MERQENRFQRGVDQDSSLYDVSNQHARWLKNFRLIDTKGQGYILTNVQGNTLKTSLSDGFIPLGYTTYNGVAYIVSLNRELDRAEIGSYPSPVLDPLAADPLCGTGVWEQVYKPLYNYTGATVDGDKEEFQTPNATTWKFNCENQVEIIARIDYDDSVNLYFTDNLNPIRRLNTGFNYETGVCNGRTYFEGSFPSDVSLLFESAFHPQLVSKSIESGGALFAGMDTVYVRYRRLNGDTTSFLGEFGPFQVTLDENSEGAQLDGDPIETDSKKLIRMRLTNIDTAFDFIEVGLFHREGTVFTIDLIDKLYDIPDGASEIEIIITGFENRIPLTISDLLKRKTDEDVAKSIAQIENSLFIGNLKGRLTQTEFDVLEAESQLILTEPTQDAYQRKLRDVEYVINGWWPPGQYKDLNNTYDYIGYFRGESYPFAVVWVFDDGRESQPFPIRGYDAWEDDSTNPNFKGILRFPSNYQDGGQFAYWQDDSPADNHIRVMGVQFDVTGVNIAALEAIGVIGYYWVRGERKPNLLYQGVFVDVYSPSPNYGGGAEYSTSNYMPIWNHQVGTFPAWLGFVNDFNNTDDHEEREMVSQSTKRAFYSTDHFFLRSIVDGEYFYDVQGQVTHTREDVDPTDIFQDNTVKLWEFEGFNASVEATQFGQAEVYNIAPYNPNNQNGFVSFWYQGADLYDENSAAYRNSLPSYGNKRVATGPYIGFDFVGGIDAGFNIVGSSQVRAQVDGRTLGNIYINDPRTANGYAYDELYDPKNTEYYRISEYQEINAGFAGEATNAHFNGDCFIQRTYHKGIRNPGWYDPGTIGSDGRDVWFGNMFSLVTENAVNAAMRYELDSQDIDARYYYPEYSDAPGFGGARQYMTENESAQGLGKESREIQAAYSLPLGLYARYGYDVNTPYSGQKFQTRIRMSRTHINDQFTDGYAQFDLAEFKDYDYRMGPINKLAVLQNKLVSIQERGINFHYVNDRAVLSQELSEGELLLGQGDRLSGKFQTVTDEIGTQHQWSIVETENAIYGVDWSRRKIWQLSGQKFRILSDELFIRQKIHEIVEQLNEYSDITTLLPDSPVCSTGVTGFWNKKYGEIGWSFIFDNSDVVAGDATNQTLVYNHMHDAFIGEHSYNSPFYITINEDFYSFNPFTLPSAGTLPDQDVGTMWLHDDPLAIGYHDYYGIQNTASVHLVMNAGSDMAKVYDAYECVMNDTVWDRMTTRTEQQESITDPWATGVRYSEPVYEENAWRAPEPYSTEIPLPSSIYLVDSAMRGMYIERILEYDGPKDISMRSVLTKFRRSFQ